MSSSAPQSVARVVITPLRAALAAQQVNVIDVLVRVQAPDMDAAPVGAIHAQRALALVIDSSGSMQGRPLEEAKRCALTVVKRLRPNDHLAVVQFDQDVRLLWPATEVRDGLAASEAIHRIRSGGSTALHAGWLQGAQALATCPESMGLKRVILLSDGEANQGERDPEVIAKACAEWASQGITTSTYGLGESFNEELMVTMASRGGGNQYYGQTADDLMAPFEEELSFIDMRCLASLQLSCRVMPGVKLDVLNDLAAEGGGYRLADLAFGAESWALLRLTVPAWALESVRHGNPLMHATLEALDMAGQGVRLEAEPLNLPVLEQDAWLASPVSDLVQRRVTEVAAAQAMDTMRAALRRGDTAAVQELLSAAKREFGDSPWVQSILNSMERLAADQDGIRFLAKEMLYSSTTLRSKIRSVQEEKLQAADDAEVPAFLRRNGLQGSKRP
ncbi:VWA domain-containing protein [Aquabacterium sp.]|uniref:vWA domain-containing protein n=1 Tax=Aquabacterium sp. TaxID=1872578 RepID=UPI0025BFF89F|nr:VWA domain-containing protein [Aquabacterium sp.]